MHIFTLIILSHFFLHTGIFELPTSWAAPPRWYVTVHNYVVQIWELDQKKVLERPEFWSQKCINWEPGAFVPIFEGKTGFIKRLSFLWPWWAGEHTKMVPFSNDIIYSCSDPRLASFSNDTLSCCVVCSVAHCGHTSDRKNMQPISPSPQIQTMFSVYTFLWSKLWAL